MLINKALYCLIAAFKNFRQYALYNIITSTTIAVTFVIFLSFLLIVLNFSIIKKNWAEQLQIFFYFTDSAAPADMQSVKSAIAGYEEVSSVRFVSGDDAIAMLRESLKGQDGILEGLSKNPLPASLEITLKEEYLTVEGVERFVNKIKKIAFAEDIEYGQKWLDRFMAIFDILRIIGFTLGGLLFLFTLFIISNTIKLMIYSRRDEIVIMKLVGATDGFIKIPFCIEGIFQGLLGAALALGFVYLAGNLFLGTFLESVRFYLGTGGFIFLDFAIASYVLLLGAILGLAGSFLSLSNIEEFHS